MNDFDEFSYHEAVDRALLATDFFHVNVETHHVVQAHWKLAKRAMELTSKLNDFYDEVITITDEYQRLS